MKVNDGLGFNDPDAWGFCRWCAFLVAQAPDTDGVVRLVGHEHQAGDYTKVLCPGGGEVPTEQPGPEAKPMPRGELPPPPPDGGDTTYTPPGALREAYELAQPVYEALHGTEPELLDDEEDGDGDE